MRPFCASNHLVLAVCVLRLAVWCGGQAEVDAAAAPMAKDEQAALFSAIQGFVGNWWNGSDLYPDPCGWTPIQGVSCDIFDGVWYITSLSIGSIHENSLGCTTNAEFRPELFELSHLKALTFFNCFISSRNHPMFIPKENWGNLAGSLESLEFRSNPGLIGKIPDSFGLLTKLQSLVLLENGISGELPTSLGHLVKLKRLVLAGNWLSGQIPDSFGGLAELLILDLSRNSLSGPLPQSFGNLTSLLKLDLSNNQLGGNLPGEIANLKNLTLLDLGNNKFSGGLRKSLMQLDSLVEMVLSNNPLGGDMMNLKWQSLKSLEILVLSNVGLVGEIPESLTGLTRLRFLGLSSNNLTGNPPLKLANLSGISAIFLDGNNFTGVLQFSEEFYQKLGRRFGAWNNPNLCFPVGLATPTRAPHGVKQCQPGVTLIEPDYKANFDDGNGNLKQSSNHIAWSGCLDGTCDLWLVVLVNIILLPLLDLSDIIAK